MASRVRVSEETSRQLDHLSSRLDLRRNIVCRLAIGRSLALKDSVKNIEQKNSSGYEFNLFTLTADKDLLFKVLCVQHEKKRLTENEYVSKYLRNHIERGTQILFSEFSRINSPVDFLMSLMDKKSIINDFV